MATLNSCDRKCNWNQQCSVFWQSSDSSLILRDARIRDSAVLFHSLGKWPCCLLPCCSPIYFYCLITILVSSNLYFCCSSVFYTIIRDGRWFEYAVWERFRAAGGRLTELLVYGLTTHTHTHTYTHTHAHTQTYRLSILTFTPRCVWFTQFLIFDVPVRYKLKLKSILFIYPPHKRSF